MFSLAMCFSSFFYSEQNKAEDNLLSDTRTIMEIHEKHEKYEKGRKKQNLPKQEITDAPTANPYTSYFIYLTEHE